MANAVRRGSSDAGSSRNRFLSGLAALVLTLSAVATFTAVAYAAPEWDDVRVNSVNRLPARCDAFPLANAADALTDALEPATPYVKTLDGFWKYNWAGAPAQRPVDFWKTDFDDSRWGVDLEDHGGRWA